MGARKKEVGREGEGKEREERESACVRMCVCMWLAEQVFDDN